MIITPCRAPNASALWMTIPIPPGHSSVSVTNIPANFDVIPMNATGSTATTITVTGFESAQISGAALNLRFKVTGATVGNYLTVSTREITLTFS